MKKPSLYLPPIKTTEWPFTLLMGLQFFLIIGVFWILKPLKKSFFIQYYDARPCHFFHWHFDAAQTELLAKNINMVAALVAMGLFIFLSRRFKRQALLMISGTLCILGAAIITFWMHTESASAVWALYVFGDLFNMLMLASFFAFLNDAVSASQAKRLFGTIIFGGVLGGALGSTLTRGLISQLSLDSWLFICMIAIAVIVALGRLAAGQLQSLRATASDNAFENQTNFTHATQATSVRELLRSNYVRAMAAIVASYEVVSGIVDYQFSAAVSHYLDGAAIGAYFSSVYMTVNIVSLSIQLFATGLVMRRLGVTHALLFLPISLLLGSALFIIFPFLLFGALLCIFDNGLNYSLNQSAKESLYIPVPSKGRYNAKAIIDIFTQRVSKAVGVNATLLLSAFVSFRWFAVVSVCIIVGWISAAIYAGRRFDRLADNDSDDGPEQWQESEKNNRIPKQRKLKLFPITHFKI